MHALCATSHTCREFNRLMDSKSGIRQAGGLLHLLTSVDALDHPDDCSEHPLAVSKILKDRLLLISSPSTADACLAATPAH